ncbi:MAG: VOC family protein [Flavobacteriales bacterium]|nr:VOC family protein [Flavobacteriales bacterium]
MINSFHLAITVKDIDKAKAFYEDILGCTIGRSKMSWFDVDFFGHQLTVQLDESKPDPKNDKRLHELSVPPQHFGMILSWEKWYHLKNDFEEKNINFLIKPKYFFEGKPYEQRSMFITDPSGNAIEFKSFRHPDQVFGPLV